MRILRDLADLINKNKMKHIHIIGNSNSQNMDKSSKYDQMYELIIAGHVSDEDELAASLGYSNANSTAYRSLKSEFIERMLNLTMFIDVKQPQYSDYQKGYYSMTRLWAALNVLRGRGRKQLTIHFALKMLPKAQYYEMTELVLEVSALLREHYSLFEPDAKKVAYYKVLHQQSAAQWMAQFKVAEYYEEVLSAFAHSKANKREVSKLAAEKLEIILPYLNQFDGWRLHYKVRMIEVAHYMSINDFHNTILVCDKAIQFLEQKPFQQQVVIGILLHQQLACFLQLRRFEEGAAIAVRCRNYMIEGSANWFRVYEQEFILALHTQHYNEALALYSNIIKHPNYPNLAEYTREMWKLFEAYLFILLKTNQIDAVENAEIIARFKLHKFLNEVPVFAKDKSGMNIPVLVIQIALMVVSKQYDTLIDRIEAIEKYCTRYLRKDDQFRSNCFIKMLAELPKGNFHPVAVKRRTERFRLMLEETPIEIADQSHQIEILPYEALWEMVTQALAQR